MNKLTRSSSDRVNAKMTRRTATGLIGASILSFCLPLSCTNKLVPLTEDEKSTLHFRTLAEAGNWIRSRRITSEALTRLLLERIQRLDSHLNSYITVMQESAISQAKQLDKELKAGIYRGPLHGIPIGVKDLLLTTDAPTTMGHAFNAGFTAPYDATVIKKLRKHGAVIMGKLNLTEGALLGYSKAYNIPKNPWGDDLWTGVSSSGPGVATAAGLCFASLGSDTGGSIRLPSSANGIVGLKTTYGLVSRYGALPLSATFDSIGPMARSVEDVAIVLEAIAGHDANDNSTVHAEQVSILPSLAAGVKGMRVGVDWNYIKKDSSTALVSAIEVAVSQFKELGATIVNFNMPDVPDVWNVITSFEAAAANRKVFLAHQEEYGNFFSDFISFGTSVTEEQYQQSLQRKEAFHQQFRDALSPIDALIAPAGGMAKGMTDQGWRGHFMENNLIKFSNDIDSHYCIPANLAGIPSLTLPCGKAENGFPPPGFQLMGSAFSEATLCRIGYAFEQSTAWHLQHPKL